MKFTLKAGKLANINVDALVLRIDEDGTFGLALAEVDELTDGFFGAQQKSHNLPQKAGQLATFYDVPGLKANRVVIACANQAVKPLQKVARALVSEVKKQAWSTLSLALIDENGEQAALCYQQLCQQIFDQSYEFNTFKQQDKQAFSLASVEWSIHAQAALKDVAKTALQQAQAWQQGTYLTRDLGNLPPNVCHPSYLAEVAKSLGKDYDTLTVEVLKNKDLKNLQMGALLGVAQGSRQPPRLITMEYKPEHARNKKPIVLVGKGVTFDSGGISLKPGAGMDEMKFDMCGAAAVFGVMKAVCHAQLNVHVIGIVAAVENMPDGAATRPGDILTSMSGKTIEVLNTDAEGRLILCDALTYAERYQPQAVIDMATLTGACVVALGSHRAAVLGNDKALVDALYEAGELAEDPVWPLPLDEEYKALLKSPFADLPNISSNREAGTIVAAAFLSEFTEQYPWAHLDIAGVAWRKGKEKGGSGRPVGLLLTYLRQLADA